MEQANANPKGNKLGAGVTETKVLEAIAKSGFPLQTLIATSLRKNFHVQEEWSYIDRDTKELRTLDVLASRLLFEEGKEQPRVRPILNLVIECKQSDLPFVFFLSPTGPYLAEFPVLAGLFKDEIEIRTDDDRSTWNFNPLSVLGLSDHSFLVREPGFCAALSKCVRKGSDLELSGSESFSGLIQPVVKALHHFKKSEEPPITAQYFDLHMAVGLGILDAPMVGVQVSEKDLGLMLLPWVRVVRHESYEAEDWWRRAKLLAVDIVHKDFFEEYLQKHLLPFADKFSNLAIKHQKVLATGKGFASGMGKDDWSKLEERLKPRS